MVNLLSNDVNRFDQAILFLHYLWVGPLQLACVLYLTWDIVGPSTLGGILLVIAFVPLQSKLGSIPRENQGSISLNAFFGTGWIGKVFSRLRLTTAGKTDRRMRIMNEIINGIKVIKMYAWEFSFADLVKEARK